MYRSAAARETAPVWRWRPSSLRASPSFYDGICRPAEKQLRRNACALVLAICEKIYGPARMRSQATTAMLLLQRFYARRSLARHARASMAAAAVFVAAKVEEEHVRPYAVINALHVVTSGARSLPYAENSPEARPSRAALFQAERVLLATLDFDAAVEQPYPVVRAALQAWRRETVGSDPKEKRPELAALERAASSIIFAAMSTDIPLLFTTREMAHGALFAAYQLASAAVRERLRVSDAAFFEKMDRRLLEAFVGHLATAAEELAAAEEDLLVALPYLPLHEALRRLFTAPGAAGTTGSAGMASPTASDDANYNAATSPAAAPSASPAPGPGFHQMLAAIGRGYDV